MAGTLTRTTSGALGASDVMRVGRQLSATELRGVSCGIGAALIWGLWPVVSKFGVRDTLSAYDITALRFGVAGILLLPIVVGRIRRTRNWPIAVGLAFGAGAPYTLMSVGGLQWAPASHAGIVSPSCSMLCSILGGWLVLGDRPGRRRLMGVALLVSGVIVVGWSSLSFDAVARRSDYWRGDLMFCFAGLLWAAYTIGVKKSGFSPLLATALVAVISMVVYLPIYLLAFGDAILAAPPRELLVQAVFQGVFAAIIALLLHTAAVAALGASRAAIFPGLVPAFAVVFSALTLGERPGALVWVGVVIVTFGMLVALGIGTLPNRPIERGDKPLLR